GAMERALDLAEPVGTLSAFLLHPAPGLLERHARDCAKHASLIAEILSLLPARHEGPAVHGEMASSGARADPAGSALRLEGALSQGEIRGLPYMATQLCA